MPWLVVNVQNYSKKGQVGMLEMLMVLVIVGIIIAIGIYFYYNAFFKGMKEKGNELSIQEQEVLLGMVGNIQELQNSIDTRTESSVDTLKLVGMADAVKNNRGYYAAIFGHKSIRVEVAYPSNKKEECNENSYPNCNVFEIYENKPAEEKKAMAASALIPIYYPAEKRYAVGKLIVEAYR